MEGKVAKLNLANFLYLSKYADRNNITGMGLQKMPEINLSKLKTLRCGNFLHYSKDSILLAAKVLNFLRKQTYLNFNSSCLV